MKLLLLSDYRYSEAVRFQTEVACAYAFDLAAEGMLDEVVLLGNIVPEFSPHDTVAPVLFHEETGLFSRVVRAGIPVRMLPGSMEMTWPGDSLVSSLGLVDWQPEAYRLAPVPSGAQPFFVLTSASESGAGQFEAKNRIAKFAAQLCGVHGAPLSQAEIAHLLRAPAQERRAAQLEARAPECLLGVIHAGTEPYFGRFGHIWAGCPGGPDWCIRLDTDRPDASELLPLERA